MKKEQSLNQLKIKYFLHSFLIHFLIFTLLFVNINNDTPQPEIVQKNTLKNVPIEIIETTDLEEGTIKKQLENYYWGIGIETIQKFEQISSFGGLNVLEVISVKKGYSAFDANILVNDKILLLDGYPMNEENNIKGDGPKILYLTILRNNIIINILVKRVKVYY